MRKKLEDLGWNAISAFITAGAMFFIVIPTTSVREASFAAGGAFFLSLADTMGLRPRIAQLRENRASRYIE